MSTPRVVFDTGVFLAQLGSGLRSGSVWRFIAAGMIIPLVSRDTYLELRRKLDDFNIPPTERDSILAEYLSYAEYTDSVPRYGGSVGVDESDRPFVELAIAKEADAIVSLDRDLLNCDGWWDFPILNVTGLVNLVRNL